MQRTALIFGALTLVLVLLGVLVASALPDGLEHVAQTLGFADRERDGASWSLFADYQAAFVESSWPARALAGLLGVALLYGFGVALGAAFNNKRRD